MIVPNLVALTQSDLSSFRNRGSAIFTVLFVLVHLQLWFQSATSQGFLLPNHNQTIQDFYSQKILEIYGENQTLSAQQLNKLLLQIRGTQEDESSVSIHQNALNCTGSSNSSTCNLEECLSGKDIFQLHGMAVEHLASNRDLSEMSPAILYQVQNEKCSAQKEEEQGRSKPKPAEVWGYGFLAVTLINLCAVLGIVFLPLMKQTFYKKMLLFMVALAVGTLVGSALLVLIPDALDIPHLVGDSYVWKVTVVMGGIYMFFLIERLLHLYNQTKKKKVPTENMSG